MTIQTVVLLALVSSGLGLGLSAFALHIRAVHLTEKADNRAHEVGGWDEECSRLTVGSRRCGRQASSYFRTCVVLVFLATAGAFSVLFF